MERVAEGEKKLMKLFYQFSTRILSHISFKASIANQHFHDNQHNLFAFNMTKITEITCILISMRKYIP